MKTKLKLITLLITLALTSSISQAYDVYEISEQIHSIRYNTGVTINNYTGEKEVKLYKTYAERNKDKYTIKYYCEIQPNKSYGYLVEQAPITNIVGYVYQEELGLYVRRRCIPNVDSYPVITDMKQLKRSK